MGTPGQLQFAANGFTASEAGGTATITISRAAGSSGFVSVTLATTNGTAISGQDYRSSITVVNFPDGDASDRTVTLSLINDDAVEPAETVVLTLSNPTGGASLGSLSTATLTISDEDSAGMPGTPAPVTVSLDYQTRRLKLSWSASNGATGFKLMRQDPGGQFFQVGADLPAAAASLQLEIPVHLYDWTPAVPVYRIDACNSAGCSGSNVIATDVAASTRMIGYLKPSDTAAPASFGKSVAVSGDGKTIAIGVPDLDGSAGSVYIYSVSADASAAALSSAPVILPAPAVEAMRFGSAVALSDDGNTLAVGAPDENGSGKSIGPYEERPAAGDLVPRSGAVFLYTRVNGAWSAPVYFKAFQGATLDTFGTSVALSGDGNVVIAGAPGDDGGLTSTSTVEDSGAAYIAYKDGSVWRQYRSKMKARTPTAGDLFGTAVATNSTGAVMAVGAPNDDGNGSGKDPVDSGLAIDSGAVYLISEDLFGTGARHQWAVSARYKAPNVGAGDRYGASVAIAGNGNIFAVGAPGEDGSDANGQAANADELAVDAGAVYVYTAFPALAQQDVAYIKAKYLAAGARYGSALAFDRNGDVLAVGSRTESVDARGVAAADRTQSAPAAGSVDVLARPSSTQWSQISDLQKQYVKASNTSAGAEFGAAVSLSGDGGVLVAGAPSENSGNDASSAPAGQVAKNGAAYLY